MSLAPLPARRAASGAERSAGVLVAAAAASASNSGKQNDEWPANGARKLRRSARRTSIEANGGGAAPMGGPLCARAPPASISGPLIEITFQQ